MSVTSPCAPLCRLAALSATPEPIDWEKYNKGINSPGFVADMKDAYTAAAKIEYPADQYVTPLLLSTS